MLDGIQWPKEYNSQYPWALAVRIKGSSIRFEFHVVVGYDS